MSAGLFSVPTPTNEPITSYHKGSAARARLQAALKARANEVVEIPCVIAGERVFTQNTFEVVMPHNHRHVIAKVHLASPKVVEAAANAAEAARADWARLPWQERVSVFLRAATLLAGKYRDRVNAATMLGQSKTAFQSEIDAACELIDFWRFNVAYAEQIFSEQPPVSPPGLWNRLDHRPLDGFVFAITPFNFSSIAANLPTAPAIMGNTAVWKPSLTSTASCWELFQLLEEAGLPKGVINLVHGHGADVGDVILARPELAGLHFTGSTGTFQHLWSEIGRRLPSYRAYPRIVGETGGKDFILAHQSANAAEVATAIARGAFEYQGQKCSAASRMYLPKSMANEVFDRVSAAVSEMKMGDVADFDNFLGAVIDQRAFDKHKGYLKLGKDTGRLVCGGTADDSTGFFVSPTLFHVSDGKHRMMSEEIFGPIATAYVYDDNDFDEVLNLVDSTGPYALTGSIFATDRHVVHKATEALRFAAGNFYVNDKPTGAVVGQQPFGGGRASGTNDKAGSPLNLLRWTSPRAIKENFAPPSEWRYPFMS